jgi:Zn-dependent oligopeptidase
MYRAYATRAAEFNDGTSKPEWDNTPVMNRMLELRREDAQMLGYNNYAEVSLAPKMADSPAQVLAFLRELAAKAKPFAPRTSPNCAPLPRTNSVWKTSSRGMRLTFPKNCCRRATPSPNRK